LIFILISGFYFLRKILFKKKEKNYYKNQKIIHNPLISDSQKTIFKKLLYFFGGLNYKMLPGFYTKSLNKKIRFISIAYTGLDINLVLGFKSLISVAFAIMLVFIARSFLTPYVFIIAGLVFGFFIPDFFINMFIGRLNQKMERELAFTADLIYVATLAGQSIYNSINMVTSEYKGHIASEFVLFLKDIELGFGKEESYSRLLSRDNPESFRRFIFMLQQAENYGSSITGIIRQKAEFSRFEISQTIDKKTRLLSTKILFPLIFLILPSFLLIVGGPLIYVIGGDLF
jgi:tight adherence protein C